MLSNALYNAQQTGLIDGVVIGTWAIGDFKLDKMANSYTYRASRGQIFICVIPFRIAMLLTPLVLVAFPAIPLILPNTMIGGG